MKWANVGTIFRREARDQLRDRRTLFMVFVLPILLYPLLGMGIVQFTVMLEQKPKRVIVVGAESLPDAPPLLNTARDGFRPELFDRPGDAATIRATVARRKAPGPAPSRPARASATAWPTPC